MSGPRYISSNIHKRLQNKREPSVPVAFSISVLSRDRRSKAFSSRTADPSNLRPVMHQSKIAVETKCNSIKLAFLNTRSLKNKSFVINDLITTNNLDFMFLIETWLEDNCSATVLTETAPPNFNFISICRTVRRGGGVAARFKDVYQCKQVSFGQYLSFEYLGIVLKGAPRILFIIIYRPPKYSPAFVEEFTELLSMISSEFDCFAIAGDFNIHIDIDTLDLLISKGLNISSIVMKDVALSDHFCIFFDILISVTTESRSVSVRKRCINENTSVLFMKAISLTPSISADSVDLLLDSFNSKVKNVIDDIAPIKVSKKNGRQKSFWRKSTAVQNMKRQCRKAELMWRKTKLEIHYSIYKDSLHAFNLELATARQTFFSNLINSNLNNTRTLFATVERLKTPQVRFPVKCSLTANAMSLLPSFQRRSVISGRRLAHLPVIQRSHRFDSNLKKKCLCLFLKQLIAKFWKK